MKDLRNSSWSTMILVVALFVAPTHAFAADGFMPAQGGWGIVGNWTFLGVTRPYLVTLNTVTGACASTLLSNTSTITGSTIWGSPVADVLAVVDSPQTFCGVTLTQPTINAGALTLRGGGGNDLLNATFNWANLVGDAGDDTETTQIGNNIIWGTGGNDKLYGSWLTTIFGENDNDTMCAQPGTVVNQFNGGAGVDTYCGTSSLAPVSATQDCSVCP